MRLPWIEMMMHAHYEIMAIFFGSKFVFRRMKATVNRKQLILFDLRRNFYLWCNIKLKQCHRLNVTLMKTVRRTKSY